ncbi:transmembrane protein 253 [Cynoglossus semilaevis]|uniref:transmembrane protein 253 n=1 Tax=Cynoglossus semilaevis TaxID=244447 RepID=UPI000D630A42|nr:transmembrane protein 253-like [Cynoglossus semilaevis]
MRQNMFQEGLYQVFFKDPPQTPRRDQVTSHEELHSARLQRWFGTVVNTRLLVTGVVQVLSALVCILTTVIHVCVSYSCSVTLPVWSSLFYVAAGSLTVEVQRKPHKFKIIILVLLNVFCLLFGFSVLLADNLRPKQPDVVQHQPTSINHQNIGSYVAKWSSLAFSLQCFLSSLYVLFLSWRGLRRYSSAQVQTYGQLSQETETNEGLLEHMEYNL